MLNWLLNMLNREKLFVSSVPVMRNLWMAPLIYEMKRERGSEVEILVLPGISAFQKAASLLGAPIGHDFCIISLSDLMTSWEIIEKRITAAATADFVTAIYNPKSEGRYWQLHRLKEIFQESRSPETP